LSWLAETKKFDFLGAKQTLATFSLCPEKTARQVRRGSEKRQRRMVLSLEPERKRVLSLVWSTHRMISVWGF
jgi:hypothetical protein